MSYDSAPHNVPYEPAIDRPGVYNVADDEPAPVRIWLPDLAAVVGAGTGLGHVPVPGFGPLPARG